MNQKKLNPSEGELIASAKDAMKWKSFLFNESHEVEKGFYTCKQICEMVGLKATATKNLLVDKIEKGTCIRKDYKIFHSGQIRLIPHYKIIK